MNVNDAIRKRRAVDRCLEHGRVFGAAFARSQHAAAVADEAAVGRGAGPEARAEAQLRELHDAAEASTGDVPMPNKTPEMDAALHALHALPAGSVLNYKCSM